MFNSKGLVENRPLGKIRRKYVWKEKLSPALLSYFIYLRFTLLPSHVHTNIYLVVNKSSHQVDQLVFTLLGYCPHIELERMNNNLFHI